MIHWTRYQTALVLEFPCASSNPSTYGIFIYHYAFITLDMPHYRVVQIDSSIRCEGAIVQGFMMLSTPQDVNTYRLNWCLALRQNSTSRNSIKPGVSTSNPNEPMRYVGSSWFPVSCDLVRQTHFQTDSEVDKASRNNVIFKN